MNVDALIDSIAEKAEPVRDLVDYEKDGAVLRPLQHAEAVPDPHRRECPPCRVPVCLRGARIRGREKSSR